jgi:DNA end-binding protein Ku
MKDKGRVALARIVFANREHILAVEPWGKGMLGTTLRYDYEVLDENDVFTGIPSPPIPKEMIDLASHILDTKAGRFDALQFKDEYELALRKLVKRKAAGKTIEPPAERPDRGNVIDLMAALRQSVEGRKAAALSTRSDTKKSAPARKRRSKSARSRGRKPKAA